MLSSSAVIVTACVVFQFAAVKRRVPEVPAPAPARTETRSGSHTVMGTVTSARGSEVRDTRKLAELEGVASSSVIGETGEDEEAGFLITIPALSPLSRLMMLTSRNTWMGGDGNGDENMYGIGENGNWNWNKREGET